MIDVNQEIEMNVGDRVSADDCNYKDGSIEAIRLIANGQFVENYKGLPDRIVVTVQFTDAVVNKRGFEVNPLL